MLRFSLLRHVPIYRAAYQFTALSVGSLLQQLTALSASLLPCLPMYCAIYQRTVLSANSLRPQSNQRAVCKCS